MNVETMKFDTPVKQEYRSQKTKVARAWCRHLKPLMHVPVDMGERGIEMELGCPQCGKILSPDELKQRALTLKKYETTKSS